MKCCNKCKIQKELDDFSKNKRNKDGLNHYSNLQPLCSKLNRKIKRENYEMSI